MPVNCAAAARDQGADQDYREARDVVVRDERCAQVEERPVVVAGWASVRRRPGNGSTYRPGGTPFGGRDERPVGQRRLGRCVDVTSGWPSNASLSIVASLSTSQSSR